MWKMGRRVSPRLGIRQLAMDKDDVRNRATEYSRAHTAKKVNLTLANKTLITK